MLCARAWGMSPAAVKRAAEAGEVSTNDVLECCLLELVDPIRGPGVRTWLFREAVMERRNFAQEVSALSDRLNATTDPAQRVAVAEQLMELQRNRKSRKG